MRLLGPILAPTWRPRAIQSHPRRPRDLQERPRAAQEHHRGAQDSPRASQKPTKMARSCPGRAQDSSKTCPDPPQNPRITHDLKRTPNFTPQSFRTSFHATKRPTSKTSGGGTPPKGGFNPPPNSGRRVEWGSPGLLVLPSPSPWTKFLTQRFWEPVSCLPPPKSSPSSLGPTPSSAAICGAGASWRLLDRKNRVPRGLQKLIKF